MISPVRKKELQKTIEDIKRAQLIVTKSLLKLEEISEKEKDVASDYYVKHKTEGNKKIYDELETLMNKLYVYAEYLSDSQSTMGYVRKKIEIVIKEWENL